MRIDLLRMDNLRCFDAVEIAPGPQLNWLVGPNGSGKTTVLEAVYLLSHGHSFRSGARDALVRRDRQSFDLFAELQFGQIKHRLGLSRGGGEWRVHMDGEPRAALAPLLEVCAVACFDPGSHALITGAAEQRRRFLDWGVFHVEHQTLDWWREYRRALRQRNALLKQEDGADQFGFWEAELGRLAGLIDCSRRAYFEVLQWHISRLASTLLPELGVSTLVFRSGWDHERPLQSQLAEHRAQDRTRGHTRLGPHHADWRLEFERAPGREFLSRGQTKLAALACILAQAEVFAAQRGEWPLLCLDDLTSELDEAHQQSVLEWVAGRPTQVWLTATALPAITPDGARWFHVEQGRLTQG